MTRARRIRQVVFVEEQQVSPDIEYDKYEDTSTHILAEINGEAVGTARWRKTEQGFKLERFAVLADARGRGVGEALVSFILARIDPQASIYLNSQVSAIGFYSRSGFQAEGEVFYEANIPHRKMVYQPK
ncbi:MAG: GNAT family N-acetyltransferase [Candidatus Marinimicrobia bacterium]|nr:GNAT family N-acetyltransferase [Candidatus Neomarinimicrobiota bacterium]